MVELNGGSQAGSAADAAAATAESPARLPRALLMTTLTAILIGSLYVATLIAWNLHQSVQGNRLLERLRSRCPALWIELGRPATMKSAEADPERRWQRLVRDGGHHARCDDPTAAAIDRFQRNSLMALASMSAAGILVLYLLFQVDVHAAGSEPNASDTKAAGCIEVGGTCKDDLI